MASVRTLSEKYGKSTDEVLKLCKLSGMRPFNNDWPLPEDVVKKVESLIKPKLVRPVVGESSNISPAQKEQVELLSRRFIFVTLTAMEKPGMEKVLRQILELRMNNNTQSQLFAVSTAIDQLNEDATADSSRKYLEANYHMFNIMREKGFLVLLGGAVAEEGLTIGSYIREKCKGTDSILVLGKNMSLNTCIFLRNQGNEDNKRYIAIQERGISSRGYLQFVNKADDSAFGPIGNENGIIIRSKTEKKNTRYKVSVSTTSVTENRIPLRGKIPGVGDNVYVYRKNEWVSIKLESKFNSGGAEGAIYTIAQDNLCAKIYFAENITERKMKKLSLLCENYSEMRGRDNSVIQRIGWPQEILYNESRDVVGYLMLKFTGVKSFDAIPPRKFAAFVNESKEKQIIAAVSLVELIRFLHDNNVILCDINQGNILFDDAQRAYLVDLDSVQITEPEPYDIKNGTAYYHCYPANVATPQFLPPEHIDAKSFTFRHDKMDDIWALQYMVFLLLTRDGAFLPYANDATTIEGKKDIKGGNYQFFSSYSIMNRIDENNPLYQMHCVISRLSQELRRAFFDSFHIKGKRFTAKDRVDARVWMLWLVKYYYELPEMVKKDAEDGKYTPMSIKYGPSSAKTGSNAKLNARGLNNFLDKFDSWLASN